MLKRFRRVREAERFNWAATRGVNEELLFENMPDDLQGDIRRHLFIFLKKVNIRIHFSLLKLYVLNLDPNSLVLLHSDYQ